MYAQAAGAAEFIMAGIRIVVGTGQYIFLRSVSPAEKVIYHGSTRYKAPSLVNSLVARSHAV